MENISLGKNGKIGKLNLSRIKAGITKEDVAKIDKNLESVFDKVDVNKDGTLDRSELDTLKEQVSSWAGVDENLEKNEINDERFASKKDKKALLNFLKTLDGVTPEDVVKAETQTVDGQTVEVVTFKDNHTETFFPDGKTISKSETENKKTEITKQNGEFVSEVVTENEGQENEIISTTTMQNGQKQTIINDAAQKTTTTITYNGEKKDKAVVVGETSTSVITYGEDEKPAKEVETSGTTEKTYTYNGEEKVLMSEIQNKGIEGKEIHKIYDKDGGYTQTQNVGSGVITTVADKDGNVTSCKKTETINGQEVSLQLDNDGNIPGVIVQNGESLSAIAKKFGCSVDDLVELNQDQLKGKGKNKYFDVGSEIKLPNTVSIEKFQKAQEGRKPAEVAKAEYARDAEIRRQKAEAEKQEREYYKQLGVINFDDKGKKVKAEGWGDREFEVIGGVGYGRQLVKYNGKLYTRSHDGKILREDYLEAHKAYVSKPKNQRNNTVSGQEGVTYVKDSNGKVWYFDEKTGKAIIKDGYNKIVKQESAFIANQLHTAADGIGTDNELLAQGVKNIYSADILAGVNAELRTKDSDYDVDVQKSQMMPVEALILDENNHKSARPLLQTLIESGAMSVEEQARTIKREMEYELAGDGKVGVDLGRVWEHFEFGTSYTSTADLNSIMQMATSREVRLEIENQYKNDPQFANLEPNEGSYVRARIGIDGGLMNWNAQEVDQFDANWIKSGAYAEATYDSEGNLIDAGDQEHRNAVVDRLVFGYQNKEALNKGLEVINDDPYSADYIYLETRAGEEVAKDPDGKYQARFTDQDNIQRYLAGFHSDETGRVDSGNVSASNTCLFKGVKPPRIQAEEVLYDANNGDYSKTFDSMDEETYLAMAELVASGDVAGVEDMKDLYNKAYNSAQSDNDKTKIKANAMISGQVEFSDDEKVDFCLALMHSIDANRGRGGSTGMSAGYTNSADYQTEQLKAILQNNPQIMSSVRERVEQENFSYTTTLQSGGGPSGPATVTNLTTDTKNSYIQLLEDTKNIVSEEVFFDSEGNQITDPDQIQAIKTANMQALAEMRKYVAELEREFKKGVDAEGWLSDAANGLSEFSGIGTDREDVATEYRNAKLMLSQFEAAAQGRLRDSQGYVISAQDLAQQMLDKQNALAETNSDYKQTIAYGKMGIVLAPVIVATGGAGAAIGLVGGGTVAVAVGSGIAAGATTYGINALEYNTSYTGNTAEAREQNLQDSLVNGATTAIGIAQMKYIGGMANNLGTVGRTSVRLGTTVAADTTVGVAAEGITTGDVSAEGLVSNMVMSGVGNVIGAKSLGKKQPASKARILDSATSEGSKPVGGSFSEKKFNQVKAEVREELANGATPERAAQIYKESDQVQVMNRDQGRALKHEVEQASGFETHHKERVVTDKKGEAVVEKINENVSRTSETILAEKNSGALAPHDAATLEDNLVNNLNTKEQIEQFKAQLKERVGADADGNMFKYEVQGKDHAADLMAKADKKLKQLANFDDVMASIPEKGGIGDMTAIKSFINNPSTTAEQLDALIAKMEANPALKKFGGSKKLIAEMKTRSEVLKAKNTSPKPPKEPVQSEVKTEPKADEGVKPEVETKPAEESSVKPSEEVEVENTEVKNTANVNRTTQLDATAPVKSNATTESVRESVNNISATEIPTQHKRLWNDCKARINEITAELKNFKGDVQAMLLKCENLFADMNTISKTADASGKKKIEQVIGDLRSMLTPENLPDIGGALKAPVTSQHRMEMGQIGNSIPRAKTLDDLNKLQAWLDNMPECSQKTHLQNQLNSKYSAISTPQTKISEALDYSKAKQGTRLPKNKPVTIQGNETLNLSIYELDLSSPDIQAKLNAMKDGEVITVGRDAIGQNDIPISDSFLTVSGKHLQIEKVGNKFVVTDMSLNGTSIGKSMAHVSGDIKTTFGHQTVNQLSDLKPGESVTLHKGDIRYTIENNNGQVRITSKTKLTPELNKAIKFDEIKMSSRTPNGEANPGKTMGELLTPEQKKVYSDSMDAFERSKNRKISHNANNILTTDNLLHGTDIDALLGSGGILDKGLVPREITGNCAAKFTDGSIPDTLTPLCSDVWDIRQNASIRDYFDANNSHWNNCGESNFLPNSNQMASSVVVVFDKNSMDPTLIDNSFGVNNSGKSVLFENGNMSRGHNYPTHRAIPIGVPANSIDRIIVDTRRLGKSQVNALHQKIKSLGLDIKLYDLDGNLLSRSIFPWG